jgi:hypothetical protein
MAKVQIADVIEPSIFQPYVIERTTKTSALFRAGLISRDSRIDEAARGGGRTVNMPFWTSLSGASEVLSDSAALTPAKVGTSKDVSTLHFRGKAWSANDLAEAVAGSDPMRAIGDQVGDYWAVEMQTILNSTLKGIFATALSSTHVHNIASEDGNNATAGNLFSDDAFLTAVFKLGDRQNDFRAMVVHSKVMQRMLALDLIDFVKPSDAEPAVPTYRGRNVIVDDDVPSAAGGTSGTKYYTIIFGPGAVGYGEGAPKNPVETDRDSLANDDILINRRHFILHPRGVKWTGSPAGASPTDAELATGGNWSKVYSDKNIKIVALITNG